MDYSLAALKLFCCHLKDVRPSSPSSSSSSSSPAAMTLFGILFQRAWLQGVLVSGHGEGRFLLDDGSGVVELSISPESQPQDWQNGMYVMVVGPYTTLPSDSGLPLIKVHKIVDLSPHPDREAMWHLEVIELLYQIELSFVFTAQTAVVGQLLVSFRSLRLLDAANHL